MRRRGGDGEKAARKRDREGESLHDSAGAARRRRHIAAGQQDQLDRLTRELSEAHEHQAAASEVLGIISRSPKDAQPVFDAIVQCASRLCDAELSAVTRFDGEQLHLTAVSNMSPEEMAAYHRVFPRPPTRGFVVGRAFLECAPVQVEDVTTDPEYDPRTLEILQRAAPYRSYLGIPIARDGVPIGAIGLGRRKVLPFTERQIELVQTFANQAVIAIENVRLFKEAQDRTRDLTEALEQQTATSAILRVISTSPTEVQPVFETIVRNAVALCGSLFANVFRFDGELLHLGASHNVGPDYVELLREKYPMPPNSSQVSGRSLLTRSVVRLEDALADPDYDQRFPAMGWRRMLGVPMLRQGEPLGVIVVGWAEAGPVPKTQEDLLRQFADQAVIAIENARLFDEVQARTKELTEALERQTATGEVLGAISRSPTDLQPVLDTIVATAARLCQAEWAVISKLEADGRYHPAAAIGNDEKYLRFLAQNPIPVGRGTVVGRTALEGRTLHLPDVLQDPEYTWSEAQAKGGFRTVLGVPLLRGGAVIGVLILYRNVVRPFKEKEIELVTTFADQAVIAIENVRLFDEVQARTKELTEALERQTATGEVLGVISRSPTDLQPVLDTIVATAARLCQAEWATTYKLEPDGAYHLAAAIGNNEEFLHYLAQNPVVPGWGTMAGRTALEARALHVPDVFQDPDYSWPEAQAKGGFRTVLGVPLVRGSAVIGVIVLARNVVKPFTDKEIDLVTTFADQAVIAIENVRLFEEVQARSAELSEALERQTATSEVLGVISRSATDLQPVLDTIVATAARLCEAEWAIVMRLASDGKYWLAATSMADDDFVAWRAQNPIVVGRGTVTGRTVLERATVHIHDVLADSEYASPESQVKGRYRTVLGVPLLRGDAAPGVIVLVRNVVRPFTEKQIELVTTFADQAVIAIENIRLFTQLETRNNELNEALEQQTATSEVLRVISNSPGSLEPVFDSVLENAVRICGAEFGILLRHADGEFSHRCNVKRARRPPRTSQFRAAQARLGNRHGPRGHDQKGRSNRRPQGGNGRGGRGHAQSICRAWRHTNPLFRAHAAGRQRCRGDHDLS